MVKIARMRGPDGRRLTNPCGLGAFSHGVPPGAALGLNDALEAAWRLEEATGDRADSSGNLNTLTDSGTVANAAGKVGTSAALFGATDYLEGPNVVGEAIAFTFSLWAYMADAADRILLSVGKTIGGAADFWYLKAKSDNTLAFSVDSGSNEEVGGTYAATTWVHVAGTYDGVTAVLYVNGSSAASHDRTATTPTGVVRFRLGQGFTVGLDTAKRIDMACAWTRALSAANQASMYNGGVGRDPTV